MNGLNVGNDGSSSAALRLIIPELLPDNDSRRAGRELVPGMLLLMVPQQRGFQSEAAVALQAHERLPAEPVETLQIFITILKIQNSHFLINSNNFIRK